MKKSVEAAIVALVMAAVQQPAAAAVTYTFSGQGDNAFTYTAANFITAYTNLPAGSLDSSSSNFDTVEFCFSGNSCGKTSGGFNFTATTDTIYIQATLPGSIVGRTYEFAPGTFSTVATTNSTPPFNSATLTVNDGSLQSAVPEPATWAMFIGGFGLIGSAMRRRQRVSVLYA